MKLAIVGASSAVGARATERFHLVDGHEVLALVRAPAGLALPSRFNLETRLADPLDTDAMARAFSGCAAVLHTANGDPAQLERMPAALCLAARAAGVHRLIYLSSALVHGPTPPAGADETSPLAPHQPLELGRARVRAEQKFFAECQRQGLVGFALRPGWIYGPRSPWFGEIAADLIAGRAWLYEGGRNHCNATYVDNVVHAITCCLQAPDNAAGPYLIGDGEPLLWERLYRELAAQLDVPWSTVQQISQLPAFKRSWRDRAGQAAAHPFLQRLLPLVPHRLKRGAKAVIDAGAPRSDSWSLPNGPRPHITQEMALAQQCTWSLSHRRATEQLDYHPIVTYPEGLERSVAWWRFAQGEFSLAA
ncbi:NAD-dependent epimerase/dehydratase family protein [Opitutus terrae]|uniref:3-beta hydroxysteroid dehydrogenase/isomerase n=1 Tax=Opitutus terrae (strain DSM 11246 / JCM 15787 / PB90-1) TaxID=452637 RepID=B1ZT73_OPITP|nr:NAD(P)H-binding protein [Opitutus terrae]ACB76527.1 3-beta hydroxysteroid dehydrogenase/isomerase [Opitutus terrae PB90-1]